MDNSDQSNQKAAMPFGLSDEAGHFSGKDSNGNFMLSDSGKQHLMQSMQSQNAVAPTVGGVGMDQSQASAGEEGGKGRKGILGSTLDGALSGATGGLIGGGGLSNSSMVQGFAAPVTGATNSAVTSGVGNLKSVLGFGTNQEGDTDMD